jgi:hypothetical protein
MTLVRFFCFIIHNHPAISYSELSKLSSAYRITKYTNEETNYNNNCPFFPNLHNTLNVFRNCKVWPTVCTLKGLIKCVGKVSVFEY